MNKPGELGQASVSLCETHRAVVSAAAANGEVSSRTSPQDADACPHFTTGGLKVRGRREEAVC